MYLQDPKSAHAALIHCIFETVLLQPTLAEGYGVSERYYYGN